MTPRWTPLAITYLVLAVVGLVGTFALNVWSVVLMRNYVLDLVQSGPAVGSIGVDIMVAAIAGSILIIVEGRRLGMRRPWLYVVVSLVTAFAFVFPLFLAFRERTLAKRAVGEGSGIRYHSENGSQ
ncbi:uncharacterized protein DUF2834 [Microbacterium sp. AG790]|uniref:DUF2834 domain-containing protein n=1 Tax=Microbacterium sp. AG790 TaxID=2183995 RepID=UPI000EAD36CE|nr:DUF2834 domain-containing protein [Microbacterium sp. AG790]RKS93074.1 uncharacterized protein DUF2834 [Microbacterium sp. AG790]